MERRKKKKEGKKRGRGKDNSAVLCTHTYKTEVSVETFKRKTISDFFRLFIRPMYSQK